MTKRSDTVVGKFTCNLDLFLSLSGVTRIHFLALCILALLV